ncbi:ParB/RepB/Spo0J family partition protein [Anaerovorax sp. IOR16]|uniref:ParB/RepB/Spo0J family partition protein n=1 Tax=Anaerovorax sp. IOR16 TaxID=2773458 RepID=UPI0019D2590A|nr:ParB/RepB/Spo0J family partition protein [Anaerovorax sp. IOR16]
MNNSNSIRPKCLGDTKQSFEENSKKRVQALRGIMSPGAQTANTDNYTMLPISQLQEFKNHPFQVRQDDEMTELVESIKQVGVVEPILVRCTSEENYEILAGHRRMTAAKMAGLTDIPAKIMNVDDDTATIIMTDTNLKQREKILPSEKAKAYAMQIEIYKRQGKRTDLTSCQVGTKLDAGKIVADNNGDKKRNVYRYIRLNQLIPDLLEMVDEEDISFGAAYELSFLNQEEQGIVLDGICNARIKKVSIEMAVVLRKLSENSELTEQTPFETLLKEEKTEASSDSLKLFKKATASVNKAIKKEKILQDCSVDTNELEQVIMTAIKAYVMQKKAGKEVENTGNEF